MPTWLAVTFRSLLRLVVGLGVLAAGAYAVIVLRASFDIGTNPDPEYARYRFSARAPNGHFYIDEYGDRLRFDTKAAAAEYVAAYNEVIQAPPGTATTLREGAAPLRSLSQAHRDPAF